MWPWRFLLLVNVGCVFGLASALIAITDDNVVHNKVVAEIWEHGDIFFWNRNIGFFIGKHKNIWKLHKMSINWYDSRREKQQRNDSKVWSENLKYLG